MTWEKERIGDDATWVCGLERPVGHPQKWEMRKRNRFGEKLIQEARGGVLPGSWPMSLELEGEPGW